MVTDHQPLIGVFVERDLSKKYKPCLFKLKEKSLRYLFTIQYCLDNNKGSDATQLLLWKPFFAYLPPLPRCSTLRQYIIVESTVLQLW